jgi:very-short-patch-repair endonuclease
MIIKESKIRSFKLFNEGIIDEFIKKHSDRYDYSKVDYINSKTNVEIVCPIHGSFFQNPYSHKMGSNCPKCVNRKKNDNLSFTEVAKKIHGNKYDYSMVNYLNNKSKVDIICPNHGIFRQSPNMHISKKSGCPKCYGRDRDNSDFIKIANKYHSNKYDYSDVIYKDAHGKVNIICPEHGTFKMSYNSHITKGYGCPFCSETSGESKVKSFLIDNNIKFQYQKKFKDCKYIKILSFDFYLPDMNLIIEYDGRQHFMPIWGGDYEFSIIKKRDQIKNQYCKDNNIDIIRIKYDDNIHDKLREII